jgi:hypothetical protein
VTAETVGHLDLASKREIIQIVKRITIFFSMVREIFALYRLVTKAYFMALCSYVAIFLFCLNRLDAKF